MYDPVRGTEPKWSESGGLNAGSRALFARTEGGLEVAGPNDDYVEACRMVRKDGFMRVAQDFRQEGFYGLSRGLPGYTGRRRIDTPTYVTDAVTEFYDGSSRPGQLPRVVRPVTSVTIFRPTGSDSSGNPA